MQNQEAKHEAVLSFNQRWRQSFGWKVSALSNREHRMYKALESEYNRNDLLYKETQQLKQTVNELDGVITKLHEIRATDKVECKQILENARAENKHHVDTIHALRSSQSTTQTMMDESEAENRYQCETIKMLKDKLKDLQEAYNGATVQLNCTVDKCDKSTQSSPPKVKCQSSQATVSTTTQSNQTPSITAKCSETLVPSTSLPSQKLIEFQPISAPCIDTPCPPSSSPSQVHQVLSMTHHTSDLNAEAKTYQPPHVNNVPSYVPPHARESRTFPGSHYSSSRRQRSYRGRYGFHQQKRYHDQRYVEENPDDHVSAYSMFNERKRNSLSCRPEILSLCSAIQILCRHL